MLIKIKNDVGWTYPMDEAHLRQVFHTSSNTTQHSYQLQDGELTIISTEERVQTSIGHKLRHDHDGMTW